MHILFVCSGNTCRSPMAEGYFRSLAEKSGLGSVTVSSAGTSAGTGLTASPASEAVMREYGIDISGHRSSPLDQEKIRKADLIVAMTVAHRMMVGLIDPSALSKTHLLMEYSDKGGGDISDPFGAGANVYSSCFADMKTALENLFLDIRNKMEGTGR